MDPQDSFWWRLTHLEPAVYKGLVTAIVGLLVTLGVVISPNVPDQLITVIVAAMAVVQALWTRGSVTPNAKVVVALSNAFEPHRVVAGEATTTASDSAILEAAK